MSCTSRALVALLLVAHGATSFRITPLTSNVSASTDCGGDLGALASRLSARGYWKGKGYCSSLLSGGGVGASAASPLNLLRGACAAGVAGARPLCAVSAKECDKVADADFMATFRCNKRPLLVLLERGFIQRTLEEEMPPKYIPFLSAMVRCVASAFRAAALLRARKACAFLPNVTA